MKPNTLIQSLAHAIAVFLYVSAVAWFMSNAEPLLGQIERFWGPVIMLLLFVFSAAVVGALVLGKPITLYLGGKKSEALRFFVYTTAWVFVIILVAFALQLR